MEAKSSTNRNKLLWITLLLAGLLFSSTPALAHYYGTDNPWGKKRTLCYRLQPDVDQDPNWHNWIHTAIDNWNAISKQTGWKFVECTADQKPDFDFGFIENKLKPPAAVTASQTGSPLDNSTMSVKIVKDINNFTTNGQVVSGGVNGWDTQNGANEKRLDPVLVMMHELTHIMVLDHVGGCSTVDFEEPVCAGDHTTRTISLSDINEIRFALGNVLIETVTPPPLPTCFTTAEAKKEFLADLKKKIDDIKADIKKLSDQLAEDTKNGPPEHRAEQEQYYANKARLEFQIAQDDSNLTVLQNRYDEAQALDVCGHSMRTVTGPNPRFEINGSLGSAIGSGNFVNIGNFSAGSEDDHMKNKTNEQGSAFAGGVGVSATLPGEIQGSNYALVWGADGNAYAFTGGQQIIRGIPGGPFGTVSGEDKFKLSNNYMFTVGGWISAQFDSGLSLALTGGFADVKQTAQYNCITYCDVEPATARFSDKQENWRTGGYVGGRIAMSFSLPGLPEANIGVDYKHVFLSTYTAQLGNVMTRQVNAKFSPAIDLVMLRLAVPFPFRSGQPTVGNDIDIFK
jgi:hypothetical protein